MQDTTELRSIITDYDIALIFLREGLRQTEILERDHTKHYPDINGRKARLESAIHRFEELTKTYRAALHQVETENEKERKESETK